MNWASKQDDSLVVHNSKSPGTQKNQVNKGPESSESMATIAVDSVTERKKMGMKGRNIYVTDETKVVSAELANNLLDDRRGHVEKIELGLPNPSPDGPVLTLKKTSTRN
ncbi:hypothetical protein ACOSQ2_008440 [Xanthoceras sorbifolium]